MTLPLFLRPAKSSDAPAPEEDVGGHFLPEYEEDKDRWRKKRKKKEELRELIEELFDPKGKEERQALEEVTEEVAQTLDEIPPVLFDITAEELKRKLTDDFRQKKQKYQIPTIDGIAIFRIEFLELVQSIEEELLIIIALN